jgi:eukaryotic-like serine/threonine-protein kinase
VSLNRGAKLGPYEILDALGAGGMGEVYKARDTRLERLVAIKVLPAKLSAHPEARQRFEREARAVSSLNHPHICALYDIGRQDGIDYLVLEFIEGETLSSRLKQGALPVDTVLRYAIEIAQALDRAHRAGVIHRDLKPGNIMLTKSGIKLLDFGLAKVKEVASSKEADATAALTRDLTHPGAILGTFQYMSPEQLESKDADARSDLFAFGAVLYEMLTGRKAFDGKSQASLIASILTSDPPSVSGVQSGISRVSPTALDGVVRACLAKDPDERWQSAGDLARALKWIAEAEPLAAAGRAAASRNSLVAWAVAAIAALAGLSIAWLHFREQPAEARSIRFTIPTSARLPFQVRISPDGSKVAFVGQNAEGKAVLWLRSLDKLQPQPLPGTEGADQPFWSPDSRQVAFYDLYDHLKRIDVASGQSHFICDAHTDLGGDWNTDGTILFSPAPVSGIYRVSASGGVPVQVTKPDPSKQLSHAYPSFLPDGKHFVYLERPRILGPGSTSTLLVGSLDSKEVKPLFAATFNGVFSAKPPGHLLFVRDGALMAQEMDPKSLALRGEPVRIQDSLALDVPHTVADFSVSKDGVLALNSAVNQHELVWMDRAGNRLGEGIPVTKFAHPSLSPDNKEALFDTPDAKTMLTEIMKLDVQRGETSLFDSNASLPAYFPDGSAVIQTCTIENKPALCRKVTGGAGRAELFWDSGSGKSPVEISPDGRFLSFIDQTRGRELWILPMTGERRPYHFYASGHLERHGTFSPDGKWIAYTCDETGTYEVYVQPFPATGAKYKVSMQGGAQPRWRGDGKELFYRTEDGKMMAVPVKTAGGFESGVPKMLFKASADPLYPSLAIPYAVTKDGHRFLMNVARDETRASPVTVITNWTTVLGK